MELDMELYQKPAMTIAEMEKLDVLTASDGAEPEEPVKSTGSDVVIDDPFADFPD